MVRKCIITLMIVLLSGLCFVTSVFANSPPGANTAVFTVGYTTYTSNGQNYAMDAAPFISDGRVFVPIRYMAYALGVPDSGIAWDGVKQTLAITSGSNIVVLTIGSATETLNGIPTAMDVVPQITGGRIMLPARWVAEALGYDVGWNPVTLNVQIFAAQNGSSVSPNTVKIGFIGPLTGDVATFGESTKNGFLLALKEHDNQVAGYAIQAVIADDQNNAVQATAAATKLIAADKVSAIVGSVTSVTTIPISVVTKQYKVPFVSPTATNPKVTMDPYRKAYAFRACFIDPLQGTMGAKFALGTIKAKTAAVLYDQGNPYSIGLKDYFTQGFTAGGGQILDAMAYTAADFDFAAELTKIASEKPDVLYLPDYYQKVSLIGKQAREKGIQAVFMGGDGWDAADIDWTAMDGGYFTSHYFSDDPDPLVQNWVKSYQAAYGSVPDALATLAYDATNIVLKGIEDAQSNDPTKIKDAIQNLKDFQTVTGKITFGQDGNPVKAAVILQIDGKDKRSIFVGRVNP